MGTGEITLGNPEGRIVDDAAATELRHELIGQIEEFRRAEALVGVVIARSLGESEGPRRAISRTRTAPLVFLAMGFVLLVMGFLLVFIALDVIGEGSAGPGVLVLLLAFFELGLSLSLVRWKAGLLAPASIHVDPDGVRLVENGKVAKAIVWSERVELRPLFNHALGGLNGFWGFAILEDENEISASPDEGWPLWELRELTPELRGLAKHKGVRESDWWARIRGLAAH